MNIEDSAITAEWEEPSLSPNITWKEKYEYFPFSNVAIQEFARRAARRAIAQYKKELAKQIEADDFQNILMQMLDEYEAMGTMQYPTPRILKEISNMVLALLK